LSVGDFLPWILTSYCFLTVPQGQWAQPTTLGFSVFVAGLTIAAFSVQKQEKKQERNDLIAGRMTRLFT